MNLQEIRDKIEEQKQRWKFVSVSDFDNSREQFKSYIEDDFLSSNDIMDKESEFDDDIDPDYVANIRAEALADVLTSHGLEYANDLDDAIEGLKFSHCCGNVTFNNVHLDAYTLDDLNYRIVRYVTEANGERTGKIDTVDISVEEYNDLPSDSLNGLVRFNAVNTLFSEI